MSFFQTIRLDILDDDTESNTKSFLEYYKDSIRKGFIVKEKAKKTGKLHLQGLLELVESDKKKLLKDMRNYITRKIYKGKSKKGDYAFAELRTQETPYLIYLCKGGESYIDCDQFIEGEQMEIVYQYGYTDEELQTYRNSAVEHQKSFVINNKKPKKLEPIGKVLLRYATAKSHLFLNNNILDEGKLWLTIISFFGEETKKYRTFILEEYYNTLKYHFSKKSALLDGYKDALERGIIFKKVDVQTGEIQYDAYKSNEQVIEDFLDAYETMCKAEKISTDSIANAVQIQYEEENLEEVSQEDNEEDINKVLWPNWKTHKIPIKEEDSSEEDI